MKDKSPTVPRVSRNVSDDLSTSSLDHEEFTEVNGHDIGTVFYFILFYFDWEVMVKRVDILSNYRVVRKMKYLSTSLGTPS